MRQQETSESNLAPFPLINLICGYFVLNLDGTLNRYEKHLKTILKRKNLGKTNLNPLSRNWLQHWEAVTFFIILGMDLERSIFSTII